MNEAIVATDRIAGLGTVSDPIPGDDRALLRIGYAIVAFVFVGLGGWAALAPIDSAAVGPGMITVQNSRKVVQHLEGGIVQVLNVQEGQTVKADDVLVELEGTQFRAELDALRVQQATLQAQEARLLAERDRLARLSFPANTELSTADPRLQEAQRGQLTLFEARRKAYDGEVSVLRQSVEQLEAQIRGLQSVQVAKQALLKSYRGEIKDLQELLDEGFADRQKLREFERQVAALEGEVAEISANAAAARAKINEAQLRVLQVEREFQTQVAGELGEAQAKLSTVNEQVGSARDRVERVQVRAPVDGRVLRLQVHTVGGVISAGQPIMEIVPDKEQLIVEARIAPGDVDRVSTGLKARIRFTGFKRDSIPDLNGTLINVSADRLVDDKTGVAYFLAQVQLDAAEYRKLRGVTLQPGMPAEAMINTGSRTMLAYLVEPIQNAVTRSFRED